jgi:hypothetical protein
MPRVPRFLSLDLGITTGYAIYNLYGPELVEYGDIDEEVFPDTLQRMIRAHTFSYSVAERPVIFRGELGDRLQSIVSWTTGYLYPELLFVDPARWKPTPYSRAEVPKGISQHSKDAIRLGLWFENYLKGTTNG